MEESSDFLLVFGVLAWGILYALLMSVVQESPKTIKEKNNLPDDYLAEGRIEFSPGLFSGIFGVGQPLLMLGIAAPSFALLIVVSGIQSIEMLFGIESFEIEILTNLVFSIFFLPYVIKLPIGLVNTAGTFWVMRDGLLMRVFKWRFHWVLIKWKDIVKVDKWHPSHLYKPYLWVIDIRGNSLKGSIHMSNVLGIFPTGVYLSPVIRNRDRLAEIVKERISVDKPESERV